MKKCVIFFLLLFVISFCIPESIENFNSKDYTECEFFEFQVSTFKEQHLTALEPAWVKIAFYPNLKPKPMARVVYLGKYSENLCNPFALDNIKAEAISTLRYVLTDFSKDKGFTGAPSFLRIRDEIRIEGRDIRFKGWIRFEEDVQFNP